MHRAAAARLADVLIRSTRVVSHKLTALRDVRTDSPTFRRLSDELVTLLAYEATRHIRIERVQVQTPIGRADGARLAGPPPLVVPVLRAGRRRRLPGSSAWRGWRCR